MRKILLLLCLTAVCSWSAGVSYPSAPVATARFATGISYEYSGGYLYNTSNIQLPYSIFGPSAFFTYALATCVNIGVDVGMRSVNIHHSNQYDFDGRMGISAGSHLKLATPYMGDVFGIVTLVRGLWFYSEAKNDSYYSGLDLTGSGGLSFHIKGAGYLSFGVKYSEILGDNYTAHLNKDGEWSNDALLGGWIAFDYFPKSSIKEFLPYLSFEFGFFPNDKPWHGTKPGLRNASFAISIGGVTKKLYGDKTVNWRP
jgi:hypothetical protein